MKIRQIINNITENWSVKAACFVLAIFIYIFFQLSIQETKTFWRYENGEWIQLTSPPKETVVFINYANLPQPGQEKVLYITETQYEKHEKKIFLYCFGNFVFNISFLSSAE